MLYIIYIGNKKNATPLFFNCTTVQLYKKSSRQLTLAVLSEAWRSILMLFRINDIRFFAYPLPLPKSLSCYVNHTIWMAPLLHEPDSKNGGLLSLKCRKWHNNYSLHTIILYPRWQINRIRRYLYLVNECGEMSEKMLKNIFF